MEKFYFSQIFDIKIALSKNYSKELFLDYPQEKLCKAAQKIFLGTYKNSFLIAAFQEKIKRRIDCRRTICLATAHPATNRKNLLKNQVPFPPEIEPLFSKEEKTYKIAASQEKIEEFIAEKLAAMV